jgi:hypothetical protein
VRSVLLRRLDADPDNQAAHVHGLNYTGRMTGSPAFDAPPDLHGAGVLRAWFTDPPGAVVQMMRPSRGTVEVADWMVGPGYARLRGRFPGADSLILVMDLSLMEGRDRAARVVMMDKGREFNRLFARTFIIPPLKTNPVYPTTLHAAAALLTAFGVDLKVESSLANVIAQWKLKPAPPVAI